MSTSEIPNNFECAQQHYAKGGSLKDFYSYYKQTNRSCEVAANGAQLWFPDSGCTLLRLPLECNDEADSTDVKNVLRTRGVWVISYLVKPDDIHPANCYDYVCSDHNYCIDKLNTNSRRDVRRGFRSFTIRLCSWDELAQKGYIANADTAVRHGYTKPSEDDFKKSIQQKRGFPLFEIWGAWEGNQLAAWMEVIKIDNWAMINIARSCTNYLRLCPNNALLYAATSHLLCIEKRIYITYGLSSLQIDVNQSSMHAYKTKMGYEPILMRRVFIPHPSIKFFVTSRCFTGLLIAVSKALPRLAVLKKAAGMCQQLAGCDTTVSDFLAKHSLPVNHSEGNGT